MDYLFSCYFVYISNYLQCSRLIKDFFSTITAMEKISQATLQDMYIIMAYRRFIAHNNTQTVCDSLNINWAPSSEFVSSSIPSWQISTAHAKPFRGARDLAFCLKVPLDSLLVWASSEGSGETARMRRLAWTFAARIGDKYQIRLTRSNWAMSWGYGSFGPP